LGGITSKNGIPKRMMSESAELLRPKPTTAE
jgi:hypothetical protein